MMGVVITYMRDFLRCAVFLAVMGVVGFVAGRFLPTALLRWDRFPYKEYSFEKSGAFYEKFGVRQWKTHVPDMSRLLPRFVPVKRLGVPSDEALVTLINETCIAEIVHWFLFAGGFMCVLIWEGTGGWLVTIVYNLFGNLPFIIIQRYNRPRLIRTLNHSRALALQRDAKEEITAYADTHLNV